MDRASIIKAIQALAAQSDGVAPGQGRFEQATGISAGAWRGKYWARWSEALSAAGLTPNKSKDATPIQVALEHLARLALRVGHVPTYGEVRLARQADQNFPAHQVIQKRLGSKEHRLALLRDLAKTSEDFRPLLSILPPSGAEPVGATNDAKTDGFVYMAKMGKHFKIGKTFSVPRRHRQIALEMPESLTAVHSIRTDDPDGIEAYWHRRFESKRTNGEWFALSAADIRAFKRRKQFM